MVTREDGFSGEMCKRAVCLLMDTHLQPGWGTRRGPGSGLCLPRSPWSPSPSPHTSPHKCEVISPRQALVLSPQMFAESPGGSRGAEVSVGCLGQGHKGSSVPLSPRAGRCAQSPPGEMLCPAFPSTSCAEQGYSNSWLITLDSCFGCHVLGRVLCHGSHLTHAP